MSMTLRRTVEDSNTKTIGGKIMERIDDRTPEEKETHTVLITATDNFMSGWGGASGGLSKCAWACKPKHADQVFDWVSGRSDMKYVNMTCNKWYPKAKHVHIYVVNEGHSSLK